MKHISLFNGIGGFQLAADWMGWENVASCEIDEWCNKVTKYHFPNCIQHGDIKTTDFTIYRGQCDILTGGDPCQRNSNANRSGGKLAESLGGYFIEAVRQIMPRHVVRENPATVRKDAPWPAWRFAAELENLGYIVPTPFKLRACCAGGRIRRERLFVYGYLPGTNAEGLEGDECQEVAGKDKRGHNANTTGPTWRHNPPRICAKSDGFPGAVDGITFSDWKKRSLIGAGNSVSPYQVLLIFKAIEAYETNPQ